MIVSDRRLRLSANRSVKDLGLGDCVRWKGRPGVGFIESLTDDGRDWVAYKHCHKDRELIPLVALRRARAGGRDLDSRRWIP